MTVTQAKKAISAALEDLQKQGVWVKQIDIRWETEAKPDAAEEKIDTAIKCHVTLGADL